MKRDPFNKYSESNRRDFIKGLAKTCLDVEIGRQGLMGSAFTALSPSLNAQINSSGNSKTIKPVETVINIFLYGGLSHTDSFNAKEGGKPVYETFATEADDTYFTQPLQKLASIMNKGTVIHSLYSQDGNHATSAYTSFSSYRGRPDIVHPTLGAWSSKLLGKSNPTLPAYVVIGKGRNATAGWLGSQYAGAVISNPNEGLKNIHTTRQKIG